MSNSNPERSVFLTLPREWTERYGSFFLLTLVVGFGFVFWYEIDHIDRDGWRETVLAILRNFSSIVVGLAAINFIIVEVGVMISRQFDRWLSRRQRRQGRVQVIELLVRQGVVVNSKAFREWADRAVEAEERGEPFNEPAPLERELVTSK